MTLPVSSSIIVLCIHNNHQVGLSNHCPTEATRHNHDLNGSQHEQLLNNLSLLVWQALMKVGNAIAYGLNQSLDKNI